MRDAEGELGQAREAVQPTDLALQRLDARAILEQEQLPGRQRHPPHAHDAAAEHHGACRTRQQVLAHGGRRLDEAVGFDVAGADLATVRAHQDQADRQRGEHPVALCERLLQLGVGLLQLVVHGRGALAQRRVARLELLGGVDEAREAVLQDLLRRGHRRSSPGQVTASMRAVAS